MSRKTKSLLKDSAPIAFKDWPKSVRAVKARRPSRDLELFVTSFFAPSELLKNAKSYRKKGALNVMIKTEEVGRHFFPPPVKTVHVDEKKIRRIKKNEDRLSGFRPDHLNVRSIPKELPKGLQIKPPWRREEGKQDDLGEPGTIFPPDTRYVFSDTSFPWCTCGLVRTASSSGSGVMIGPRHLMTASHVINWGPNNTAGWVKFTPLNFDSSEPFGSAYATRIYWWQQVNGSDGISSNEAAFDYVVCVLDRRLGEITGWMGSRGYSSD